MIHEKKVQLQNAKAFLEEISEPQFVLKPLGHQIIFADVKGLCKYFLFLALGYKILQGILKSLPPPLFHSL